MRIPSISKLKRAFSPLGRVLFDETKVQVGDAILINTDPETYFLRHKKYLGLVNTVLNWRVDIVRFELGLRKLTDKL